MASQATRLDVQSRSADGSRAARRLRREGRVPGVVYGGDGEAVTFSADSRELRLALAHGGAVIDLVMDGEQATPVVVKDHQRDAVKGHSLHVDLLRVRLDKPIQATTIIDLVGGEEAPGAKEGGILEQVTREINIEALPTAIPDDIQHDVSGMEMNDSITLSAIRAPEGVTFLDDLEETLIATLSPPRIVEEEEEELEEETELVGEDGEPIEVPEGEEPPAEGEGGEAAEGGGEEGGGGE